MWSGTDYTYYSYRPGNSRVVKKVTKYETKIRNSSGVRGKEQFADFNMQKKPFGGFGD